jgi:hypothetical protein
MIATINKPIEDVVKQILTYVNPELDMKCFGLIEYTITAQQPICSSATLDNPKSLKKKEYTVTYQYRTEGNTIGDKTNPNYLNGCVKIADINKTRGHPDETFIRWRHNFISHPVIGHGYELLDALLLK